MQFFLRWINELLNVNFCCSLCVFMSVGARVCVCRHIQKSLNITTQAVLIILWGGAPGRQFSLHGLGRSFFFLLKLLAPRIHVKESILSTLNKIRKLTNFTDITVPLRELSRRRFFHFVNHIFNLERIFFTKFVFRRTFHLRLKYCTYLIRN